ncbi:MAG: hypothetical protein M1549_02350 [Candidatus Dependentiae bacterium]|nr:hypothetical protein [Candidatus Dependentiae bacterium]
MRLVNYLVLAGLLVAQLPASISAQPAPIGGAPQICAVAPLLRPAGAQREKRAPCGLLLLKRCKKIDGDSRAPRPPIDIYTATGPVGSSVEIIAVSGFTLPDDLTVVHNLTVGNDISLSGTLFFYDSSGHHSGLTAGDLNGGNTTTLVLPTSNGSSGNVLRTDGAGNLSWYAIPSPADAWLTAGNNFTGTTAYLGTINNKAINIITDGTSNIRMSIADSTGDGAITANTVLYAEGGIDRETSGTTLNIGTINANIVTIGSNGQGTALELPNALVTTGGSPYIHKTGTNSFFAGTGAGSTTATGALRNTGIGADALASAHNSPSCADNTVAGYNAGNQITTGAGNTLIGSGAGTNMTTGNGNIAAGTGALQNEQIGNNSVAVGTAALLNQQNSSSTDVYNTAVGYFAGKGITGGINNTMIGGATGQAIGNGNDNTAVGYTALNVATASQLTAVGSGALAANTGGQYNTGIGYYALGDEKSGSGSTAVGYNALGSQQHTSTTEVFNTAVGYEAGVFVAGGTNNTLIGASAGKTIADGSYNTLIGASAGATIAGSNNIIIGANAGTSYAGANSSNICMGNVGADETNTIRIGTSGSETGQQNACYIAGISGITTTTATANVVVSAADQLGTAATTINLGNAAATTINIGQPGTSSTTTNLLYGGTLLFYDTTSDHHHSGLTAGDLSGGNTTTLVLPTSNGSSGDVLSTDGSGYLSWYSLPVPPDSWLTAGNNFTGTTAYLGTTSDKAINIITGGTGNVRMSIADSTGAGAITANTAIYANGGITASSGTVTGLLTANGGISTTGISASGTINANGGFERSSDGTLSIGTTGNTTGLAIGSTNPIPITIDGGSIRLRVYYGPSITIDSSNNITIGTATTTTITSTNTTTISSAKTTIESPIFVNNLGYAPAVDAPSAQTPVIYYAYIYSGGTTAPGSSPDIGVGHTPNGIYTVSYTSYGNNIPSVTVTPAYDGSHPPTTATLGTVTESQCTVYTSNSTGLADEAFSILIIGTHS